MAQKFPMLTKRKSHKAVQFFFKNYYFKNISNHKTSCGAQIPSTQPHPIRDKQHHHQKTQNWARGEVFILGNTHGPHHEGILATQAWLSGDLAMFLLMCMALYSHLKHNCKTKTCEDLHITPKSFIFPRLNVPRLADTQNKNEQTSRKKKVKKKNHWVFDGSIVFSLCEHLRESFIHILNGKRQLKQVVYY